MTTIYKGATEQFRQIVHHHAVLRRGLERRAGALCEAADLAALLAEMHERPSPRPASVR
jgi:hypothetical protein